MAREAGRWPDRALPGTPAQAPTAVPPLARGYEDGRIDCANVYKWFPGGIVLEDVSLQVEAGQFVLHRRAVRLREDHASCG